VSGVDQSRCEQNHSDAIEAMCNFSSYLFHLCVFSFEIWLGSSKSSVEIPDCICIGQMRYTRKLVSRQCHKKSNSKNCLGQDNIKY